MAEIDTDNVGGAFAGSTPTIRTPATTTTDRSRFAATPGGVFQTDSPTVSEQSTDVAGLTDQQATRGGSFEVGTSATTGTSLGIAGPPGPIGPEGPAGADGATGQMGTAGTNGADGEAVTDFTVTLNADDTLTFVWTLDGVLNTVTTDSVQGPQGIQGEMGVQGLQGKSVTSVALENLGNNSYRFTLNVENSDGTGQVQIQTGTFSPPVGPRGVPGTPGDPGTPGAPGTPGGMGVPGNPGNSVENFSVTETTADGVRFEWDIGGVDDNFETGSLRGATGAPGGSGPPGAAGQSVTAFNTIQNADGTVTFSWEIAGVPATFTSGDLRGDQGIPGNPGMVGQTGRGLVSVAITADPDGNDDNGQEYIFTAGVEDSDGTNLSTLSTGPFTVPRGPAGTPGTPGTPGDPGADGDTPDIMVGNVVTLNPGESVTVTRQVGSPDDAPIFDFGIPQGIAGPAGTLVSATTPDPTDAIISGIRIGSDDFRFVDPGTMVEGNPTDTATEELAKITIGDTTYDFADPLVVVANPGGDPTTELTTITIGTDNFTIPNEPLVMAVTPGPSDPILTGLQIGQQVFQVIDDTPVVEANGSAPGTADLNTLRVGNTVYDVVGTGGGGGGDTVTANDITPILSSIEVLDTITIDGAEFRLRGAPVFVPPVAASRFDINIFYDEDLFPGARTTIEKPVFDRDDGTLHQFRIEPRVVGLNGTQITDVTFNFVNTSYGMFARIGTSQQFGMNLTTAQVNQFNTYDFDSQGSWTETNGTDVNVIVNQDQAVQFFSVRDWYTFTGTGLPTALSQFTSQGSFTRGDDFTFSGGTEAYVLLPQTTFGTDDPVSTYTFKSGVLFLNNTVLLMGNSIAAGFSLYELNDYAGGGTLDVTIT